jgi:alpha-amylase/alpha-mannosidase (GH57 family)
VPADPCQGTPFVFVFVLVRFIWMKRHICIHGHFYQPPRENPWLESIEIQDSAFPYHDWNERITAECYAPNSLSRILEDHHRIAKIVNNFARISFDVGPTLLSWLESNAPDVYEAILEADRVSRKTYSGHGSALAQIYNHMIMPLATQRQKYTQSCWALRDFEHRFGRQAEGMWLPETAVDTGALEILSELEIKFTILAPHQAYRWRRIGDREWHRVSHAGIDTTVPYRLTLPSGRSIVLFFFNGEISRAVAFEGLLNSGDAFARRLLGAFHHEHGRPQIVNIATDGETYGHHHQYGEMALAYAIRQIDSGEQATLTNYGEFLERFPPLHEVEIEENTAWSCAHGIERWRSHCGCCVSNRHDWNQYWRAALRAALEKLEAELSSRFEECGTEYLRDPWKAQDDYIQLILDRSSDTLELFLDKHATHLLDHEERVKTLKLLEIQRESMLMFTSCAWFFDDISGIEAVQNLYYAARAIQLAEEIYCTDLESGFLGVLAQAISNSPEQVNGRHIYETRVKPAVTGLEKVAAHFALSSLFENYGEETELYCYGVYSTQNRKLRAGRARMVAGRVDITSRITLEFGSFSFCAMHLGDHNLTGGIRNFRSEEEYEALMKEIEEEFNSADLLRVVRLLDRHFPGELYSLKQLFRDEQRNIVDLMLKGTLDEVESAYHEIYEPNVPLMRFLEDLKVPLPRGFALAAQLVLNNRLQRAIEKDPLDVAEAISLLQQAKTRRIALDSAQLGFQLRRLIKRTSDRFRARPADSTVLAKLANILQLISILPFPVVLWDLENAFYEVLQTRHPIMKKRAERGDEIAETWLLSFESLAQKIRVKV